MNLWECTYTCTTKWTIEKWVDYWWSTSAPTIETQARYWEKIHPGGQVVSDFSAKMIPAESEHRTRMIERQVLRTPKTDLIL